MRAMGCYNQILTWICSLLVEPKPQFWAITQSQNKHDNRLEPELSFLVTSFERFVDGGISSMRVYEPFACGESISRYVAATEPGGTNVKCTQTDPYDRCRHSTSTYKKWMSAVLLLSNHLYWYWYPTMESPYYKKSHTSCSQLLPTIDTA